MAYSYSPDAPNGWLIDDTGHFTNQLGQAVYDQLKSEYQARQSGTTSTSAPAPSSSAAPTSTPTQSGTTPAKGAWSAVVGGDIIVDGRVAASVSDPTQANKQAQNLANTFVGSFGSVFNFSGKSGADAVAEWVGQNRPDLVKAAQAVAASAPAGGINGAGTGTTLASGPLSPEELSALPADITGSETWKTLTDDQKRIISLTYKGLKAGDAASKADAAAALEKAKELADPFFKSQIRYAQDELDRSVASTSADAESQRLKLIKNIDEINQDLAFGRDQLTLEQQSELAGQLRQYEAQLQDTQQTMAEAGLAFSSPRAQAEGRLATEQQATAESTRRRYARQQRDLETNAARGIDTAQTAMSDVERKRQEAITSASRQTESIVGSGNLPGSASGALGGITGTAETARQQNILNLEAILKDRTTPLSF